MPISLRRAATYAAVLGVVVGVVISLSLSNYVSAAGLNLPGLAIGAIDLLLLLKCKAGVPTVLLFSAAAGLVLYGALGLPA